MLRPSLTSNCYVAFLQVIVPTLTRQRSCARIRDPYQNLSNLHRDIILSINHGLENMAMDTHSDLRDGVHINLIVSGLQTRYGDRLNRQEVW